MRIEKKVLVDLFNEGKSSQDMSAFFGVSETTIKNHLKAAGLINFVECPDNEKLLELANIKEKSNKDIAKIFNVSGNTIWIWLKRLNIDRSLIRNNEGKRPSKEVLEQSYKTRSQLELAKIYNVSSVTIANWLKYYDLDIKPFKEIRNSKEYKRRYTETCIEKYGFDTPLKNPDIQKKLAESYSSKNGYRSTKELDCINSLSDFLSIDLKPDRSVLGSKELDGYCQNSKIAIEFCGLYWHSEKGGKNKKYHYDKWRLCFEQNIKLFTIYDNEWRDNSEKIKKYIYMNMGFGQIKIHARNTEFREVDKGLAKMFCDEIHIQSSSRQLSKAFGLFLENELVSLMTFGNHHRDNKTMVMNRFCGKFDHHVIGGASKIIMNARKILGQEIITWSDNRWSSGNVYSKCGFKFTNDIQPDYVWTDFTNIYSKQSRRKSATGQPMELTEKEYNESLGLSRIWDCGKKKWII